MRPMITYQPVCGMLDGRPRSRIRPSSVLRGSIRVFSRVAIVNRGEAAMRLIHAVGELNAEGGQRIETVALYTDADATATFVREADLTYYLGSAAARPYVDLAVLERALAETGADAAWVGWGFVAEEPAFAELCEKLGVTF